MGITSRTSFTCAGCMPLLGASNEKLWFTRAIARSADISKELRYRENRKSARLPGMTTRPSLTVKSELDGMRVCYPDPECLADKLGALNEVYREQNQLRNNALRRYYQEESWLRDRQNEIWGPPPFPLPSFSPEPSRDERPAWNRIYKIDKTQEQLNLRWERDSALECILHSQEFAKCLESEELQLLLFKAQTGWGSRDPLQAKCPFSKVDMYETLLNASITPRPKKWLSRSTAGNYTQLSEAGEPSAWMRRVIGKIKQRWATLCKSPHSISVETAEALEIFLGGPTFDRPGVDLPDQTAKRFGADDDIHAPQSLALDFFARTLHGKDGIEAFIFHSTYHREKIKVYREWRPMLADRVATRPLAPFNWSESGRGFTDLAKPVRTGFAELHVDGKSPKELCEQDDKLEELPWEDEDTAPDES